MAGWTSIEGEIVLEVARIATARGSVAQRAEALLEPLHRLVPFEASWLALLDPDSRTFVPLVIAGYDERSHRRLEGPEAVAEVELAGLDRTCPARRIRDLPIPIQEVRSWTDYLWPAGFREALGVGLFTADDRFLGVLGLNTVTTAHPTDRAFDLISRLAPTIAGALDPIRALGTVARIVGDAAAGVALTRAGNTLELPGLPGHVTHAAASPVIALAAQKLAEGAKYMSFLSPLPSRETPIGHLRITVLAAPADAQAHLAGVVIASPPGDLDGLTKRELEVIGLVIEGWTNARIAAELMVTPRTVGTHLEHILAKLGAPTRAHAAARAQRTGAYIPRQLRIRRGSAL